MSVKISSCIKLFINCNYFDILAFHFPIELQCINGAAVPDAIFQIINICAFKNIYDCSIILQMEMACFISTFKTSVLSLQPKTM